jgi:hypothetical protein
MIVASCTVTRVKISAAKRAKSKGYSDLEAINPMAEGLINKRGRHPDPMVAPAIPPHRGRDSHHDHDGMMVNKRLREEGNNEGSILLKVRGGAATRTKDKNWQSL